MLQKFFLAFFLLFSYSYSLENNTTTNSEVKQNVLFLSYVQKPERVYVGQIFKIKIKVIVATTDFDNIKTSFTNYKNIKILNPENQWKWFNDNIYYNSYYIKVLDSDALFPTVGVSIYKSGNIIDNGKLEPFESEIVKLKKNEIFSQVLAKKISVVKTKTTKFDEKSNILVMQIESEYANLRDFKVQNVIKQGIDSYSQKLPYSKIYYYAILPKSQEKFIFSYFNIDKNSFEKFIIPLNVQTESTSTELEINPRESKLATYKNIALVAVAFLSIIIYFFRRKIVYLLIFIFIGVYIFMFYNPFDTVILDKNTHIKILPTSNSTIFYITDRKIIAEKLGETKKYIKVLLPNGKIGWIKKEQ